MLEGLTYKISLFNNLKLKCFTMTMLVATLTKNGGLLIWPVIPPIDDNLPSQTPQSTKKKRT